MIDMKKVLLNFKKHQCGKCGRILGSVEDICHEYLYPVSRGGTNTQKNIRILCSDCYNEKML